MHLVFKSSVVSCAALPGPALNRLALFYDVSACPVLSCPVLSCPGYVLSSPVLSCLVLSCCDLCFLSYLVLLCPVEPHLVLSWDLTQHRWGRDLTYRLGSHDEHAERVGYYVHNEYYGYYEYYVHYTGENPNRFSFHIWWSTASTARHRQHRTATHSAVQHRTAPHSTAQHRTAPPSPSYKLELARLGEDGQCTCYACRNFRSQL